MSRRRGRSRQTINLPAGVQRVVSGGREYFYLQLGRGTDHAGPRTRLPDDPYSPEFWEAIRQAQGIVGVVPLGTVNALADAWETAWSTLPHKLSPATQAQYRSSIRVVRQAWGNLKVEALRPSHVLALMVHLSETPGKANNVLTALRIMCRWAMGPRELLSHDPTTGVEFFESGEGRKPWGPAQLDFAEANFTGMLRRAYFLARYTEQRISDVVRLGPNHIDDGAFSMPQKKTGVQPWCPIFPELEAEMATWERGRGLSSSRRTEGLSRPGVS